MGSDSRARQVWRFHPFELDGRSGELRKHGQRVRLQDKPRLVLELLLERAGDMVTREELCARLWPDDTFVEFDAGLNTAVNKVRTALGDSSDDPRYVETLGRRGYRFVAPVETEPAAPAPTPTPPEPPAAQRPTHWPRRAMTVTAVMVAGAAAALYLRPAAAPHIRSLAVLPLANLSGDASQDYFAEGMTDALITRLAGIRSLRVISRQSVMQYQKSRKPLPEIARELGVEGVIEGSVLREGGRVRVTAQLLHAPSDRHLWARSYERAADDVLGLQAELAAAIADEVRARVTAQEQRRLSSPRPISAQAFDDYLHGRFFWNRRGEANLRRALEYYEKAIAAEPGFALAHAALAETYGPLGYGGFLPPWEATPRMKAAALEAVRLDPELAEGHTALAACLSFHEWKWAEAEKEFARAVELDPRYATAHLWYGLHLLALGRFDAALRERRLALESDPLSPAVNWGLAVSLAATGQVDAAMERLRKTVELEPAFYVARVMLGDLLFQKGLHDQALDELRKAEAATGGIAATRAALAAGYARAGRRAEARALLAALIARGDAGYVPPVEVASVHAALGDSDQALSWLERAYAERAPALHMVKTTPMFTGLRSDPRFQDLLRRMDLR